MVYTDEGVQMEAERARAFEAFVIEVEPRLRRALVATYGSDKGRDATASALGWAWENWSELEKMDNKVAYLYRVGQTKVRTRRVPIVFERPAERDPWVEPSLAPALAALTEAQRTAVVLVFAFHWKLREVAELTGVGISTVQSHLDRGLRNLRTAMEVPDRA